MRGKLYRQAVASLGTAPPPPPFRPKPRESEPIRDSRLMDQFSRDLTRDAAQGRLDPVTGREQELERMIEILCRRTKNNPVLLGEPGVGKTALAGGLAQAIAAGQVPEPAQCAAAGPGPPLGGGGHQVPGEFESGCAKNSAGSEKRWATWCSFWTSSTPWWGGQRRGGHRCRQHSEARPGPGEIQVIGATTQEEYRRYICKDPALERRFQPVQVEAPDEAGGGVHSENPAAKV